MERAEDTLDKTSVFDTSCAHAMQDASGMVVYKLRTCPSHFSGYGRRTGIDDDLSTGMIFICSH
jgi:hypothetical protein